MRMSWIVAALLANIVGARCIMMMRPREIARTDGKTAVGTVRARNWSNPRVGSWIIEILFAMSASSVCLGVGCCQSKWRCNRHVDIRQLSDMVERKTMYLLERKRYF